MSPSGFDGIWTADDMDAAIIEATREAPLFHLVAIDGMVDAATIRKRLRAHGLKVDPRGMGSRLKRLVDAGKLNRRYYSKWRVWLYAVPDTTESTR